MDKYALENNNEIEIIAYFALTVKPLYIGENVSNSVRKRLDGLFKNTENVAGYLIGQLGKNDVYKDRISGNEILGYAISLIIEAFNLVGGRFVFVECEDCQKLISFYEKNNFKVLQKDNETGLVQLFRILG
ncbi:hypothetical protein GCM10010965_15950 [Caldalkalibacillus thermarum]|uniref:acetyltransferase n=1 Tax=Caldalkalibacillus thermarum TaxID=296745 RepID=UPI00166293AD|nr:acetyltransferase [Caldalkalibacillus thermarum]GGK23988.1 hypothetical protein GCM10010965_15950 [Caldalkalibacillus thermarum]